MEKINKESTFSSKLKSYQPSPKADNFSKRNILVRAKILCTRGSVFIYLRVYMCILHSVKSLEHIPIFIRDFQNWCGITGNLKIVDNLKNICYLKVLNFMVVDRDGLTR